MKPFPIILFIAFALLTGATSSCVFLNKLQYIEPTGNDESGWEKGWNKNALGLKEYQFKKMLKDSSNNDLGLITFEFFRNDKMFAKSVDFAIGLSLEAKQGDFMKKIDLDSLKSTVIRDSLEKDGHFTARQLPYKRFYLLNAADSTRLPMAVSEFFMGYTPTKYRGFRMYSSGTFKEGDEVRIITGDAYLDGILKRSSFIFRTKKKVELMTHMN